VPFGATAGAFPQVWSQVFGEARPTQNGAEPEMSTPVENVAPRSWLTEATTRASTASTLALVPRGFKTLPAVVHFAR
jgi:hypothetical protein